MNLQLVFVLAVDKVALNGNKFRINASGLGPRKVLNICFDLIHYSKPSQELPGRKIISSSVSGRQLPVCLTSRHHCGLKHCKGDLLPETASELDHSGVVG